jgi:predicted O-methyltransferase YrrM
MVLRRPALLNRVLSDPDTWERHVAEKYSMGDGFPQIAFDQLHRDSEVRIAPVTFLDGGSLPTDLALLRCLAGWFGDCSYFEIGTWRGESVANVAAVATECTTLNLSPDEMKERGISSRYIDVHGHFSRELGNVTQLYGNSGKFDFKGLDREFDLVFIDGDHHYDYVWSDTRQVIAHLVHEKSIIVWHDYAYNPEMIRFEVMAAILDGSPGWMHAHLYHIGHTKCAVYIAPAWNKGFQTGKFTSPVIPEQYFELVMKKKRKEQP